jgi:hypothetical protein
MKTIRLLFKDRAFGFSLVSVIFQQALVASGTYVMGRLAGEVAGGHFDVGLGLYLLISAALSGSFAHYLIVKFMTKASKSIGLKYLQIYSSKNFNHPDHWRNQRTREARHDVMVRSGQESIQSAVHFFVDLVATTCNILFNTLSVYLVTNRIMAATIVFAGLIGLLIVKANSQKIANTTKTLLLSEASVTAILSRSWDNIFLGNRVFFNNWMAQLEKAFLHSQESAMASARKKDFTIAVGAFVTTSLVLGVVLTLGYFHQTETAFIVSLVVMLPRSLQTVAHIQVVQAFLAQWESLKQQLLLIDSTVADLELVDLSAFINDKSLSTNSGSGSVGLLFDSAGQLNQSLGATDWPTKGRLTVCGPNGSGKTSMLLKIKKDMPVLSTLIPAHHQLDLHLNHSTVSSGERAMQVIRYVAENTEGPLLLDEWDANLSVANMDLINSEIDTIAQSRLVIEIRHRKTEGHCPVLPRLEPCLT